MVHLYVRGWRGMRVEVVLNRQEGVGRGFWGERHDLGSCWARCRETHGPALLCTQVVVCKSFFRVIPSNIVPSRKMFRQLRGAHWLAIWVNGVVWNLKGYQKENIWPFYCKTYILPQQRDIFSNKILAGAPDGTRPLQWTPKKIYTGINITIPANLFTQFFRVLMGGE